MDLKLCSLICCQALQVERLIYLQSVCKHDILFYLGFSHVHTYTHRSYELITNIVHVNIICFSYALGIWTNSSLKRLAFFLLRLYAFFFFGFKPYFLRAKCQIGFKIQDDIIWFFFFFYHCNTTWHAEMVWRVYIYLHC